jgi:orotate phosphoribosyltransferase
MPVDHRGLRSEEERHADRERLRTFLRERCFISGTFRLASGRTSNVYFDCKRATLDPEGLALVADLMLDEVEALRRDGVRVDAVGGPTVGADPIAAGMALRSHQRGSPLPAFLVRRRVKDHGTSRRIENDVPKGASVLVVEDVITSGRSVKEALETVLAEGLEVAAVACIVDREEGGDEALAPHRLVSLFTRGEVEPSSG